ncbi:GNAT family N-acetyltransferase [Rhizobium tubonense]|uniref:GNAT family N-acetyltransferase n=1 Tax=Rhizobium tubonense TaxID=484088 RepID=A0A2W4CRR4_9HYPH|nr:GNAT family N-acetyltransferase [Rhizobium tubonense]PZM15212.1 GNAT family N-acetyltransferase [Rhizobium tubonense]
MTDATLMRLDESFSQWDALLDLIVASFAYMNDLIDPPSSALALTPQSLKQKAEVEIGYVALEGEAMIGCIFCRPEDQCLYIGKLAVLPVAQGRGIGKQMLTLAEEMARERSLPELRLETRIELTGNHAVFTTWGFRKTAENSHPGFDRTTSIEMRKTLASAPAARGLAADDRR